MLLLALLFLGAGAAPLAISAEVPTPHGPEEPAPQEITGDELRADLDTLKNLLATHWTFVEEKREQTGYSLDDLLQRALAEVKPRQTLPEASLVLHHFVSALEDGHTRISVPGDEGDRHALPVRIRATDSGLVIAQSRDSQLKPGDRLLSVDGETAEAALAEFERQVCVSTAAARRGFAANTLCFYWNKKQTHDVEVERVGQSMKLAVVSQPAETLPWTRDVRRLPENWVESQRIGPDVGYLRISSWLPFLDHAGHLNEDSSAYHPALDAAFAAVKTAPDLILDLRGNGGGDYTLGYWFAGYFIPAQARWPFPTESYCRHTEPTLPTRLYVLVDENCFSATDTFLYMLQQYIPERVTFLGRESSGGNSTSLPMGTLPYTRARLSGSQSKIFGIHRELTEGHPVKITVPVRWTRADIAAGRDPDLEAALELIASQPK